MVGDYIRREDALEITTRTCGDYATAFSEIRKLPAADVAEVVHGQWQGEGDGYADGALVYDVWVCSNCGHYIDDGTDDPECLPNYCPVCGAKMDGGFDDGKRCD
jgi:rubrerythrin